MGAGPATTGGPTRGIPGYQYGPEEDRYRGGGGGRRTWIWWAAGALALLAVLGIVAYFILGGGGGGTPIPLVKGLPVAEAKAQVTRAGLKPKVVQQTSTTVAKGIVIDTSPPGGNKVAAGSVVTLDVSSGPAKVKVPDVVGQSSTAAQNALQQFNVKQKVDTTSSKPPGTVVRQDPVAGTLLAPGSTVTIFVSQGAQVPDVRGDPANTAQQILQNDGFNVQVVTANGPAGVLPGLVFNQSPSAGTSVPAGSTVIIYVQPNTSTPPTPTPTTPTATPTPTPTPT
jgi:serine/threonine-protein kinase